MHALRVEFIGDTVESIRRFHDQESFLQMVRDAGFGNARYRRTDWA